MSDDVAKSRIEPPESPATAPFWDATRRQRLMIQWCRKCDRPIHYPREACPSCLGDDLEFRPVSGRGTVYAASMMPKPANPLMAGREPYVVALIDLAEGVRMMSNVVGLQPAEVAPGLAVKVTWEPLSDGRHLPQFEPSAAGDDGSGSQES